MGARAAFNFEAFLDGITGAGLFSKRVLPGAPALFLPEDEDEQLATISTRPVSAKLTVLPGLDKSYGAESREAAGLVGLKVKEL